ncbi:hypothetical protein [Mesorhizobium retamae]|uniref:Uncharacterized protein n=1 Tax=Mesorhizobium retamae TaxID=2912854 RepID=A0ABS9QM74_9HYPH|nr:hypothetical protein [Mesorhizobium sp. IRAMC:0171]MCG7508527.1 hypothetical protein [Mesorhizobium sp. IRAMC:0171]
MSDLSALIATYKAAKSAWETADRLDDTKRGPEWTAYLAAETALVVLPCHTLSQVRSKVAWFLDNEDAYDALRRCFINDEETLVPFLQSLLGGPTDNAGETE